MANNVVAPMPGKVVEVKAKVGDVVSEGDIVAIVESMKMEMEILSESKGVVTSIAAEPGSFVQGGSPIIELK